MRGLRVAVAAGLLTPLTITATPAHAQDVQYQTVTKIELPGAAGTMLRVASRLGGGSTETIETTYIKGKRMRSDVDKQSTITDLEGRRMIHIDHAAKTYTTYSFDEALAQARQAGEELKANQRTVSGTDQAETQLSFKFSVEDAKQRERIAGYNADRFFLTMQAEGEYAPEEGAPREKAGTLVVLTEMWSSRDVPIFGAQGNFDQTMAKEYAAASGQLMEGIAAAFADDPQLKVAFEASARELSRMEGIPVRTITRFVSVAPDKQFDRAMAVDPKPSGPGVAAQAARAGLGRLAARAAGAQQQQAPQQEAAEMTQMTFMSVTSEVRNVSTKNLDASLFEIPAGYREVKPGGN
jgi:hypothetical protein